jgi:hypothetical protein
MKRDYENGQAEDVSLFVGIEIEKTPAFGLKTLFVTGIQDIATIEHWYEKEQCEHIFFGANHSFNPSIGDNDTWIPWEDMIYHFLKKDILCTLDIPVKLTPDFNESGFCEYNTFIPQIRVPIPYVGLWNYNTMIKIDDVGFKQTNPGVWCHSLHDLMDREKFTEWSKYGLDKVIE